MNKYQQFSKAAQKQRKKDRMCLSKTRYESAEAAFQKGQQSYQCPHCQRWHRTGQLASLISQVKRNQSK